VRTHAQAGKPILAECGGLLALLDGLSDQDGRHGAMFGLLPGEGRLTRRLVNLGMHSASLDGGELRGHSFHHATVECPLTPLTNTRPERLNGHPEAVYRLGAITAGFMHFYFPSNPVATAALFRP